MEQKGIRIEEFVAKIGAILNVDESGEELKNYPVVMIIGKTEVDVGNITLNEKDKKFVITLDP